MGIGRKLAILLPGLLVLVLGACDSGRSAGAGVDVRWELEAGERAAATWIAAGWDGAEPTGEEVVALGYLERLRLGLGSPFRLAEHALADPRLEAPVRRRLAWALLARTVAGESYRVDPSALDAVVPGQGSGAAHLELIEGAVTEASDPRAGELAVRLAYGLAAAEGSVTARAPELAAQVAALLRDRELARADARSLLASARATGADPLVLLGDWRERRLFTVERPWVAVPLSAEAERAAMELAPKLLATLRQPGGRALGWTRAARASRGTTPLLGRQAALRLAAAAESLNAPPQTPIVVAVDVRAQTLQPPGEAGRAAARRFIERAWNEERFAAEHALLRAEWGGGSAALASTALAAAVALRPYAQESVWFPGSPGPSTRELEERFGLAAVRFDDDVPAAWRPYFRRMLALALADLQHVLPALELRGLRFRIGELERKQTLALHDPRGRTIVLPPRTGAGTIAHEVAHDLDWQVALRRYRVRGDYGTDRAVRRHDRLSAYIRGLAEAALAAPAVEPAAHADRPAEIFARSVDWFVMVALAREGRMNGYLSSFQDDLLTGYGTVRAADPTGMAGRALMTLLDEVAPVHPETRTWFLRSYGPGRSLTPYDVIRRVLEAPLPLDTANAAPADDSPAQPVWLAGAAALAGAGFDAVRHARETALADLDTWVCRTPGAHYDADGAAARRRLALLAAGARARGLAVRYASSIAGRTGREWSLRSFYGPEWPAAVPDSTVVEVLLPIIDGARKLEHAEPTTVADGFHILPAAPGCPPVAFPALAG